MILSARNIMISVLAVIAVFSFYFYQHKKKTQATVSRLPIRVGVMNWPGFYPVFLADRDQAFLKQGINVEIHLKNDNSEINSACKTGLIDICFGTFADHLFLYSHFAKVKFIYATDYSRSDVLVTTKEIKKFSDLIGKTISFTEVNSFSEFFILGLLEKNSILPAQVNFKEVQFDKVLENLETQNIIGGHTWQPETGEAIKKGYKVFATAGSYPGLITDGFSAQTDVVDTRQDELIRFVKIYSEYQSVLQNKNKADMAYLAGYFKTSVESIEDAIKNDVQFLGLQENKEILSLNDEAGFSFWASKINNYYLGHGQIKKPVNLRDLIEYNIINKVITFD